MAYDMTARQYKIDARSRMITQWRESNPYRELREENRARESQCWLTIWELDTEEITHMPYPNEVRPLIDRWVAHNANTRLDHDDNPNKRAVCTVIGCDRQDYCGQLFTRAKIVSFWSKPMTSKQMRERTEFCTKKQGWAVNIPLVLDEEMVPMMHTADGDVNAVNFVFDSHSSGVPHLRSIEVAYPGYRGFLISALDEQKRTIARADAHNWTEYTIVWLDEIAEKMQEKAAELYPLERIVHQKVFANGSETLMLPRYRRLYDEALEAAIADMYSTQPRDVKSSYIKANKKTLDAIEDILVDYHGDSEAGVLVVSSVDELRDEYIEQDTIIIRDDTMEFAMNAGQLTTEQVPSPITRLFDGEPFQLDNGRWLGNHRLIILSRSNINDYFEGIEDAMNMLNGSYSVDKNGVSDLPYPVDAKGVRADKLVQYAFAIMGDDKVKAERVSPVLYPQHKYQRKHARAQLRNKN